MSDIKSQGGNKAPANLQNLEEQFGPDTTRELVRAYLEDTHEVLERMHEAIIDRDSKALKPLAHMLKSASRIVGAAQLSQYSGEMEEFCSEGQNHWLTIESFFETFSASFESTAEYLRQYLQ
jgi:HPt (histidine-containing phosphotransfer) domain-containing protein